MVEVASSTECQDGVTFVWATVRNTRRTPQRVELESDLDGPIWPPVHESARDPRWTDGRWTETIPPGGCRGVGFATPADPEPDSDLVRVVSSQRATESENEANDPTAVLASLDEWAPPSTILRRDR